MNLPNDMHLSSDHHSIRQFLTGFSWIIFIFIALTLAYALLIPPWETPDAPSHYLYIREILLTNRLPIPDTVEEPWPFPATLYEWHHPPLYYAFQSLILNILHPDHAFATTPFDQGQNPNFSFEHPSARYRVPSWPWWAQHPVYTDILTLRLISIFIFGLPCIMMAGWIGFRWCEDITGSQLWALALALHPQFLFVIVSTQNDALAILWACAIWVVILTATTRDNQRGGLIVLLGSLVGLALISKLTTMPVTITAGAWVLWQIIGRKTVNVYKALIAFGIPILSILAIYVILEPHHALAMVTHLLNSKQTTIHQYLPWRQFTGLLIESFWARFGWMNVPTPKLVSISLTVIVSMGWILAVPTRTEDQHLQISNRRRWVIIWMMLGIMFQVAYILYIFVPLRQPQGRFLFPTLIPILGVAVVGWYSQLLKYKKILTISLVTVGLLTNALALFYLVKAYWM